MYELEKFPEKFKECLQEALSEWRVTSISPRKELSGKSGAYVWLVDVIAGEYNGPAILKFATRELISIELENHRVASACTPKNAIPEIVKTFEAATQSAFLMSVAGNGLLEVDQLSTLPNNRLNVALGNAARQILAVWNVSSNFDPSRTTVSSVLESLIKRQIGNGSRIPDFMSRYANLDQSARCFRYNGVDYPNPMSFADTSQYGSQIELSVVRGSIHGDFHPGNILVARYEDKPSIYIIDFEKFRENGPLFFDTAYLELSLLLEKRYNVSPQRWATICTDLIGVDKSQDGVKASSQDDVGLFFSVGALRYEASDWIRSRFSKRTEDFKKQILIGRIAAGLDFCNKRYLSDDEEVSNRKKFFSFIYASSAAKELLDYSRIEIPKDGKIISISNERPLPKNTSWKDVWAKCNSFDESKSCYILISDSSMSGSSSFNIEMISRLPWSLVIDLDELGIKSKFASGGVPVSQQRRSTLHLLPHQIQSSDNLSSSVCWLAGNSITEGSAERPLSAWKSEVLPAIRKLVRDIYRANVPKPIKLVVISNDREISKKRNVLSAIQEESSGFLDVIILSEDRSVSIFSAVREEFDTGNEIICSIDDFCLGMYQIVGDSKKQRSLWIPVRSSEGITKPELLSDDEAALFRGAVELVPSSPSYIAAPDGADEFFRGGTITWDDLDARRDVDRDITRKLVQHLHSRLVSSPNESYSIDHSPGAGGTTVARRASWELRDDFPALIVTTFSTEVIEILDMAFRRTSLPLLVVVEATDLTAGQRDYMYTELRGRNVRFLMLDVRRHSAPRDTASSIALTDPMSLNEAQRFFRVFSARTGQEQREKIRTLAISKEYESYRSAFFFGLYSFEKNFKKVPEFVFACMDGVAKEVVAKIMQLALVSRYSQERVPLTAFNVLIGLNAVAGPSEIEELLGPSLMRLVFMNSHVIGIKHPLLAEEILKAGLQPVGVGNPDAWRIPLNEFCIHLVREIVGKGLGDSSAMLEILYDLFLERQSTEGIGKTRFSELIEALQSPYGERRVLEALTEAFPENPIFLSHLARHMNYKKTGTFEDAERVARQAIVLDESNDEPYHVLGMIYRFELERRLQVDSVIGLNLDDLVRSVDTLFASARAAFEKSFSLARDSRFPLITPIQMTIHTLGRLFSLSNFDNFAQFLSSGSFAGLWCRSKLDYAQTLFDDLHQLEAVGEPSERRVRCDADLQQLLGNSAQVVSGLKALLGRADVRKGPVRRLISSAYLRDIKFWSRRKSISVYREVAGLCDENLMENPSSTIDLRMWIKAYRMLPDASITVAIEKFSRAAMLDDNVEFRYYLMILNFIAHRLGFPGSLAEARRHYDFCRQNSSSALGRRSIEWLAKSDHSRAIPLVHYSELGEWDRRKDFFSNSDSLALVEGRVDEIRSLQSGTIAVDGMPAFFAPKAEFRRLIDINSAVIVSIGFSYEGLRAWNVRRKEGPN